MSWAEAIAGRLRGSCLGAYITKGELSQRTVPGEILFAGCCALGCCRLIVLAPSVPENVIFTGFCCA